jgi:hypothetical protein
MRSFGDVRFSFSRQRQPGDYTAPWPSIGYKILNAK